MLCREAEKIQPAKQSQLAEEQLLGQNGLTPPDHQIQMWYILGKHLKFRTHKGLKSVDEKIIPWVYRLDKNKQETQDDG